MKKILITLAVFSALSAQAQKIGREPKVMENCHSLVHGEGVQPFAVEGLKAKLDKTESTRRKARAARKAIDPMLTTFWAQDSPYNKQLPSTGGLWGSTPQTGCVATAMAQILNYFQYPKASIGKGSYSTNGTTYRTVDTKTTFAWDQMLPRYSTGYTDAQMKAVGLLMRDCGYCSNMIYTSNGSGTTAYDAGYGITHNMQYDSLSLQVANRLFYNDKEWKEMIYNELQAGRPILYDAVDPSINMGHAFVFDGMDAEGKVHVNWGWAGSANGYFDIDKLSPSYSDMYGQQYKYNFNDEHKMIIGFKPQSTPDKDETYKSFFAMQEADKMWVDNDSIKMSELPVFNFSHLCFNGLLGLVIESQANEHAVVQPFFYSNWESGKEISYLDGLYLPEAYVPAATLCDTDGKTPRPDGKYYLYLISWSKQEMSGGLPQYVRIPANSVAEDEENFGLWEGEIVNGHWDARSFHRASLKKEETGIGVLQNTPTAKEDGTRHNLSGQYVGSNHKGIVIKNGKKYLNK